MSSSYYFEKISQQVVHPLHAFEATSPRKVLFGINLLLAVAAIVITSYSVYLVQLLYDPNFFTGWINWFILAVVGIFLTFTAVVGMRGAHQVSLELLLSYFWSTLVLFAPLLLGIFAVFNISFYTRIWFKHQWETPDFDPLRRLFCDPKDTWDNKCISPLFNSPTVFGNVTYNSTMQWCQALYNATDCQDIRNDAIDLSVQWGYSLILTNTIIGVFAILLMATSIYISVQILTHPVITQSMLEIINYLLIIPIASCIGQTVGFWWIGDMEFKYTWLPKLYLSLAVSQIVALPLGIAAGRLKSRNLLRIYIALVLMIIGGLALAVVMGWTLATIVLVDFHPSKETVAEVACRKELPGCTQCDNDLVPSCPEWDQEEVLTLFSLDFRLTGMVSSLEVLYLIGALIVASLVDNNLKNYKTDFI